MNFAMATGASLFPGSFGPLMSCVMPGPKFHIMSKLTSKITSLFDFIFLMQSISTPWLHVRNHVLEFVTQEDISRGMMLCFSSLLAPPVSSTAKTGV